MKSVHIPSRTALTRSVLCQTALSLAILPPLLGPSAHAADAAWNVDAAGTWVTDANWNPALAPGIADGVTLNNPDVATFGFALTANRDVTVDANRNLAGITFANASGFKYNLNSQPLLLSSGGTIQITSAAATGNFSDQISAAIRIQGNAGSATFTGNAVGTQRRLDISGGVTGVSTAGNTTTLNLNGNGNGNNAIFTGAIGNGANGGDLKIVKSGAGLWLLGGANTFTGGVTLQSGVLQIANAGGFGTGTVQLQGGTLVQNNANYTNTLNITGPVSVINTQDNANGAHTGALTGNGTLTFAPTATLAGVTFTHASSWKWNGDISGFTGTIIKTSDRNMIFQGGAFDGSNAKWQIDNVAFAGISLPNLTLNPTSTFKMGELSGSSAGIMVGNFGSAVTSTYEVGKLNTSTTYNGRINNGGGTGGGPAALTKVGTGTLTLTGASNYTGPTTVSAGTIVATNAGSLGASAGTVSVASGATVDLQANVGAKPFTITGNGATGNGVLIASTGTGTTSGVVTLATDSIIGGAGNLVLNGAVDGGFGITKTGAGTTTLGGTSTYTGGTIISGGTLSTGGTGSIASSFGITVSGSGAKFLQTNAFATAPSVTVTQGTLEAIGTVGAVSVASGAGNIITTNNTNGNPLVTGALAFGGAATLNLTTASTTPVIAATDLTTTSGGIVVNVSNASWVTGTYPLIGYSGTFTGSATHFTEGTIPNLGARQTADITNSGSAINLVIGGDFPVWTGAPNGNWTTSVDAVPTNWKLNSNGNPTNFLATDSVLFDDSATGTTTVNISAGNVSPISTTFTNIGTANAGLDYTLTGTSGIASGSLIKSGAGPLTIQNANSYPGGTTLSDGTLNLNNASAIGTGTLTIGGTGSVVIDNTSGAPVTLSTNNAQAWNGDFTFTGTNALNLGTGAVTLGDNRFVTVNAGELTAGGAISGLFSLSKSGPGTLVLTGANTYSNGTNVNEGTLRGTTASIQGAVNNNGAVVFDQATDGIYAGAIGGGGSVTKLNSNTLTLSGGSTFSGGLTIGGGTVQLNNGGSGGSGMITLGGNTLALNFNANMPAGITGAGTINVLAGTTNNVALQGDLSGFTGVINVPPSPGGGNAKTAINIGASGDLIAAATINIASGGTLFTEGAGTLVGATINVSGPGNTENLGALRVDVGSELSGTINLLGDTSIGGPAAATNSGTISGPINGAFGITKVRAAGAVNLNGTNGYTGPTVVSAGILRVNGSTAAASAVSVSAGATLAGTGTVGGTVTTAGTNSTIAPGNAGIGTLATGTTSLTGVLATELNAASSDHLNITGDLTLVAGATLTVSQLAPAAANKYVLVKYTGTLTGTFAPPVLPPSYSLLYDTAAKEIAIVKSGFNGFMDGFPLGAADKLPDADPDKDGVPNLIEYALAGFDPTVSNPAPGTLAGGQVSFTKRAAAVTNGDLTYAIEESTTLGVAPDPWGVVSHVLPDVNNSTTISYTLPVGQPKEFARLKVTQN